MKSLQILSFAFALGAQFVSAATGQTHFATIYNVTGGYLVGLTARDGVLYGAINGNLPGAPNCGTIFSLEPPAVSGSPWTETGLYGFAQTNDACVPLAAPVPGPNGALYGTTMYGGTYGYGALYELQPPASPGGPWTEGVLYSFGPFGGGNLAWTPGINLVPGPGGSFYLITEGGANGGGALVQMQPPAAPGGAWTATVLYSFPAGLTPYWLTVGPHGVLYAANAFGGTYNIGEVLQLTPPAAPGGAWTATVIYSFEHVSDPNSLTVASDGTIYGTTWGTLPTAGLYGVGAVFALAPPAVPGGSWSFTLVHNFGHKLNLLSPLILRDGNLYGTVASSAGGAAFELQPPSTPGGAWSFSYLYQFTSYQQPTGSLVMDQAGNLFGVTAAAPFQPVTGMVYRLATP